MWKKGAVVIVKHGDKEIADAIAKGFGDPHMKALECENYFLKKHNREAILKEIAKAEYNYGYNWTPPNRFVKGLREFWALIEYGFAVFVDKFMTIKF